MKIRMCCALLMGIALDAFAQEPVPYAPGQQVILVTGSTGGLGREVAKRLASQGAHVIVHGRNSERGRSLVAEITDEGKGTARFYAADFASFDAVRELAHAILRDYDRLDVLVNNAGFGSSPNERLLSEDGHEYRFQVNYLSPFLLTHLLLPRLRASAPSRIVNVSSLAQRPIDFDDVMIENDFSGGRAYAQSKLAQIMFTFDLAEQLQGTGVMVNSLHPATYMPTGMVLRAGAQPRATIDEGADAVMQLIVSSEIDGGQFFRGLVPSRANEQAYDRNARARLRRLSQELTGVSAAAIPSSQDRLTAADVVRFESPEPDHIIRYGDGELQFGKLRLPPGDGPHPVVIFVHGGCWLSQFDITHTGLIEQGMSDAGVAVWSIEYRRVGDDGGGWPGTFHDVANGADFLQTFAAEYDLDLSRVVASGHSAGGYFALWLAARHGFDERNPLYVESPIDIQAVLALAPAPDLEGLHESGVCGNVIDRLMGGAPTAYPERYRAASLMQLAPIGVPQILVTGSHDAAWGPVGHRYYDRALAVGDSLVRVVEAPESGHFEMIVPTTSSWSIVHNALDAVIGNVNGRF